MNLADLMERFATVDAARDYLEKQRWPDGPECPRCGLVGEAYKITPKPRFVETEYFSKTELKAKRQRKPRKGLYKCKGCRKPFTVTVGTIFEDSHIPLNKWVIAIYMMCSSKKGVSAHQIHRMLSVTYRSAWFMCHRIRLAMSHPSMNVGKLGGIVEADECYIGGRRRGEIGRPGPKSSKAPVVSLVERGGNVRSFHMGRVTAENLRQVLTDNVEATSRLMTDENNAY